MADENNNNTNENVNANDKPVDPFEKHIDIAIEAQDGKTDAQTDVETGTETDDKGGEAKQPEGGEGSDRDNRSKSREEGKPKDPEVSAAARKLAGAKDLVLKGQGPDGRDLVVKGGAERRFFEQRENARAEARHEKDARIAAETKLQQVQQELDTTKQSIQSIHGIEPRAVAAGARIVQDMQRDPIGTLKKLVAEAAANGYNVEDLGVGVDTQAIARLIEERLPKQTDKPSDEQIVADAHAEVTAFYGKHPDAKPHDTLIARVLNDHPDETLTSVYFKLRSEFAERGFDWNKSLEENLADLQESDPNTNKGGGSDNQQNNNEAPLPGGGGGNVDDFKLNKDAVSASDDTGDIVREAMREAGMKI